MTYAKTAAGLKSWCDDKGHTYNEEYKSSRGLPGYVIKGGSPASTARCIPC